MSRFDWWFDLERVFWFVLGVYVAHVLHVVGVL